MKRRVCLSVCFIVIVMGAFGIYKAAHWHKTVDTHSLPDAPSDRMSVAAEPAPQRETVLKKVETPATAEPERKRVNAERKTVHTEVPEKNSEYEWRSDEGASPTQTRQDPLVDQKAQAFATEKKHLADTPETMDPDERHSELYAQLLEQHGDIPEVHIFMDYERRWENNEPLTLEERIEGLTATLKLFPSESTRKTLEFHKWQQSKGTSAAIPATSADMEYLRSKGISVTETSTEDAVIFKVSTK